MWTKAWMVWQISLFGRLTILKAFPFFFFSSARTLQQVSVSFIACMASWNTAAQCGGATTLPMSRSDPPRRERTSTTRTCQVRPLPAFSHSHDTVILSLPVCHQQWPSASCLRGLFCTTWILSSSRSKSSRGVWALGNPSCLLLLLQPFHSLQCSCCQWTYTVLGHLLMTSHAHIIYMHAILQLMMGVQLNPAAALDHVKQCQECWLTTSSATLTSDQWLPSDSSMTFLPCVVKWIDPFCFRCTGRRQQLPEPVGVHQWHHRSDGTRVKGTQLSGIPALLRGAALVWRAAPTPRGIRLTHRCFGHVPVRSLWKKGKASQHPHLVITWAHWQAEMLTLLIATCHWRVKNTCRWPDYFTQRWSISNFYFIWWVSAGWDKTATKLQVKLSQSGMSECMKSFSGLTGGESLHANAACFWLVQYQCVYAHKHKWGCGTMCSFPCGVNRT